MGAEHVFRIVKTTAVVAAVVALFCATYFSAAAGAGLLAGAAWGCLNLLATGRVVRTLVAPERPGRLRVLWLSFVKFPLLYGAGFLLLRAGVFPPESLVSGFSLVLVTIVLKALGASAAGSLDSRGAARGGAGGPRNSAGGAVGGAPARGPLTSRR
ncbi:MAG: hypothetical protein JW952_04365 [Candidatus Eisenbacteria bacterium]|nr:hypothetical protein [Candidatus Eisenbacteria bacterium]